MSAESGVWPNLSAIKSRLRGYTSIYGGHTSEPGPPAPRLVAEITRIEGTHRYLVTDHGLDTAKFLTCVQDRVLRCGLAELATATRTPGRLRSAATAYRTAVENHGSIIRATKHQPPQPHSNTNQLDPHTTDLTQKSGFAESSLLGGPVDSVASLSNSRAPMTTTVVTLSSGLT